MIHFTNLVPGANPRGDEWSADFADISALLEDPRIRAYEDMGDPRVVFYRWSRTLFGYKSVEDEAVAVTADDPSDPTQAVQPSCFLFAEYGGGRAKVTLGYLSGDREAIETLGVWTPPAVDPGLLAIIAKKKHPKHRTLRIPKGVIVRSTGMPGGIDPNLEDTLAELKKRGESVLGWTVDENRDEYKIKVMSAKAEVEKVDERPRIYVP